jgi:hypothetical protein
VHLALHGHLLVVALHGHLLVERNCTALCGAVSMSVILNEIVVLEASMRVVQAGMD